MRVPNVLIVHRRMPAHRRWPNSSPWRSREAGGLNYGIGRSGGASPHDCTELFKCRTGIRLTHIPFAAPRPMLAEPMAGRLEVGLDNIPSAPAMSSRPRLRALAITGAEAQPGAAGCADT